MRKNNQGFSLVELIIVIAIMAVLIALLPPQMIQYINRSREQKDESMLDEILHTTEVALSFDPVYQLAATSGASVIINDNSQIVATPQALQTELRTTMPDNIVFVSKKYKDRGGEKISITFTNPDDGFVLDPSWD